MIKLLLLVLFLCTLDDASSNETSESVPRCSRLTHNCFKDEDCCSLFKCHKFKQECVKPLSLTNRCAIEGGLCDSIQECCYGLFCTRTSNRCVVPDYESDQ